MFGDYEARQGKTVCVEHLKVLGYTGADDGFRLRLSEQVGFDMLYSTTKHNVRG